MPARTPEELTGDLDASLAWRRAELTVIRGDVQKAAKTGGAAPRERMLLRAAVVLLYAHWEGFLREACQGYLDYVARLRLKYTELSRPLAQTAIKQLAARTVDRHDESLEALTEAVLSVTARARMSRKNVVDTRGSLDYDALERILEALGIETSVFVTKRSLIDIRSAATGMPLPMVEIDIRPLSE